jgi:type I restriction enzyme, R subunit
VEGKAAGVIEAKKEGSTLTGVAVQAEKYSHGMPAALPAWIRPLPFLYQSTGVETRFTNRFDPQPRSRRVFHFHKPETFAEWLNAPPQANGTPSAIRSRLHMMPPLVEDPAVIAAEIVEDLQAALEEFAAIEADLSRT